MQPVRAERKHGCSTFLPARARIVIFLDECAIAQQRFDACPLVRCRDPGPQVAPGLAARGPVVPGLREHGAAAQHTTTSTLLVRCRSAARSSSSARTRSRRSESTTSAGPSSGGIVSVISCASGMGPCGRKKCSGRVAHSGRPLSSAERPLTPGQ